MCKRDGSNSDLTDLLPSQFYVGVARCSPPVPSGKGCPCPSNHSTTNTKENMQRYILNKINADIEQIIQRYAEKCIQILSRICNDMLRKCIEILSRIRKELLSRKKHRKLSKMLTETEYICKEILNGKEDERRT